MIFISAVFVLIAQAIGLLAYYSKRNQYSKSAQNVATILPAIVFTVLAAMGALFFVLLVRWGNIDWDQHPLLSLPPPLIGWVAMYLVSGIVGNIFLSILVQLVILLVYPPKIKPRRRRGRGDASTVTERVTDNVASNVMR